MEEETRDCHGGGRQEEGRWRGMGWWDALHEKLQTGWRGQSASALPDHSTQILLFSQTQNRRLFHVS